MISTAHSFTEYPVTLRVRQVSEILGISETNAYKLMRSKGFPTIRVGRRMIVPRDRLVLWMDKQTELD